MKCKSVKHGANTALKRCKYVQFLSGYIIVSFLCNISFVANTVTQGLPKILNVGHLKK